MKSKHLPAHGAAAPSVMSPALRRLAIDQRYRATEADVENLARDYLAAQSQSAAVGSTYLKVLAASAQQHVRDTTPIKPTTVEATTALYARGVAAVHKRFYPIILATMTTPDIAKAPNLGPVEKSRRATERNRRTNFARSAYSTLRAWVRAGHDLLTLNIEKMTKRLLIAGLPPAKPSRLTTARLVSSGETATLRLTQFIKRLRMRDEVQAAQVVASALDEFNAVLGLRGKNKLRLQGRVGQIIEHNAQAA